VIRAILDTNVLASGISGVRQPNSAPGELLRRWRRRTFILILSEHLFRELERTLGKRYFANRLSPGQIDRFLATLRAQGEMTSVSGTTRRIATHPEDDLILAAVASAEVDYLVTASFRPFGASDAPKSYPLLSSSPFSTRPDDASARLLPANRPERLALEQANPLG